MTPRLGDRSLFPTLEWPIYLSHSAVSPPSAPVTAAIERAVQAFATRGLDAFGTFLDERETLRGQLAQLLNADADEVAFIPNTSLGVSIVAQGFDWSPGDGVLVFDGEFPANVSPWQVAARRFELVLDQLPLPVDAAGTPALDAVEARLKRGDIRLVAISAVQFQTGRRMPLAELATLCHAHGAALFVDAIQSIGMVPTDVRALDIDFLAAGAHKWLMGIEGGGVLYVKRQQLPSLTPVTASWLGHEHRFDFLFNGPGHLRYDRPLVQAASVLEGGVQPTIPHAALGASLPILLSLGVEATYQHVSTYLDRLEGGLIARGFSSARPADSGGRSGILAVQHPTIDATTLSKRLANEGVSATMPDGYLRFAPHWPNALDEIPRVLAAMDRALAQ